MGNNKKCVGNVGNSPTQSPHVGKCGKNVGNCVPCNSLIMSVWDSVGNVGKHPRKKYKYPESHAKQKAPPRHHDEEGHENRIRCVNRESIC